jgi:hypothetical protein
MVKSIYVYRGKIHAIAENLFLEKSFYGMMVIAMGVMNVLTNLKPYGEGWREMKKIEGNIDISGIKRCYVGDAVIKVKCPDCKTNLERDYSEYDYLSYPEVGEYTENFWCTECDCEFILPMNIKSATITIEYDESKVIKD